MPRAKPKGKKTERRERRRAATAHTRPHRGSSPRPATRRSRGLIPKQAEFVRQYLLDLNATQAAIRAGYSARSASRIGVDLLQLSHVRKAIDQALARRADRVQVKSDRVLEELARVAFAGIRDVVVWGPSGVKLRDSEQLAEDVAAAVASVSEARGRSRSLKVTMHDKVRALELLGKHLKLFVERTEVTPESVDQIARKVVETARELRSISGLIPPPPAEAAA